MMRVIPVIDLQQGHVVRGVGGRRDEYRPLVSQLMATPTPAALADAFARQFALRDLYLADLDAIAGAEPAWDVYAELIRSAAALWVDAGVVDLHRAEQVAGFRADGLGVARVIVGLESLAERQSLPRLIESIGPERLTLSLDLKAGRPLAAAAAWRDATPEQIAADALHDGVRSILVLDLASVGENRGPSVGPLCAAIRQLDAALELTAGGGVRHVADLRLFEDAGCDAALVASALHDGRITPADLRLHEKRPR